MKKLFLLLALIVPMMASAVKIVTNEIDEFTGKRTVITSWESLEKGKTHIRLRYQNDNVYLDFKTLYDGAVVVAEGSKLMAKNADGDIVSYEAITTFTGGRGNGAVGLAGSKAWGIEIIYAGDIAWLLNNKPTLMRIYTTDGYLDKKISDKDGNKIQELAKILFENINNDK